VSLPDLRRALPGPSLRRVFGVSDAWRAVFRRSESKERILRRIHYECDSYLWLAQPLTAVTLGVWVAAGGVATASLLAVMQTWVVHRTGSTAIAADRTHYVADAVLNGAVLAALALTSVTGWERLDPIFALVISGYMIKSARHVAVFASRQLLDHELPDEQRERIKAAAIACSGARGLHDLRTRDAGDRAFVEFRLEVDGQLSVREGHEIVDAAERAVATLFLRETQVIGHVEPAGLRPERGVGIDTNGDCPSSNAA
jgi:ferrous-iron efflux pump FieF